MDVVAGIEKNKNVNAGRRTRKGKMLVAWMRVQENKVRGVIPWRL